MVRWKKDKDNQLVFDGNRWKPRSNVYSGLGSSWINLKEKKKGR